MPTSKALPDLSFVLVQAAHFGELSLGHLMLGVILECFPKVALGHALVIHVEVGLASKKEGLDIVGLPFQQKPHHCHHPWTFIHTRFALATKAPTHITRHLCKSRISVKTLKSTGMLQDNGRLVLLTNGADGC